MYKTTFIPIIAICVHDMVSFNVQSFLMHVLQLHIYMAWFPLYPFPNSPRSPCCPSLLPFVLPSTYLAPSSCDRNRPPSSQVACKLTLFAPPFTQLFHPFQLPRNPIAQRLTTTTLGPLRSHYAEQFPPMFSVVIPSCSA